VTLTHQHFRQWLDSYSHASAENNPKASANLFAESAAYYETLFADPMSGQDAILRYWDNGAQTLKDKESTFEILAVQRQRGIARWRSSFTVIASGERMTLDCPFVVEFDEHGLCRTFREW
jgi:hypothetical protein